MSFAVWDFIFQPFLFQIRSSGGFYLCRTNLHRSLTPLQQALFCAPLVSFPYPVPKTAHRATQGQVWFWLAGWRFSGGSPPFRQSRIRTQAEEKIPLPHFSEMEPVKSVIPCKRFFKPSGVKAFSLFMRRIFCVSP